MIRTTLEPLIEVSKDGEWGKTEPFPDAVEMRVIRGTDFEAVRAGEVSGLPIRYVPRQISERKKLRPSDLLIETAGGSKDRPTGRTLYITKRIWARSDLPLTCASFSRFIRIKLEVEADSLYLFWHLQWLYETQRLLKYHTQHTGVARFQWTTFSTREMLELPDLKTQQKIAAILSAYDDLIENNLRRTKILEEMAQTLYREWFVKFRFPGHQKVKMVNSPLGKIPDGWEIKPLESLISEHIGGGWGKEEPNGAHTQPAFVVRGTDIPDARRCNISNVPYRYHTLSNLRPRQLTVADIIFEVSGGSKGQPVGRTLHISSEFLSAFGGERVICASFCKRIKPNARLYASEILYLSFLEAYDSGEIEQFQVQSTGISNFKWTEYIQQTHRGIPSDALQARFRELVSPLFSQIATLGLKNRNLRQTRDLLLPKLISGKLDVSELDITIPEVNA